MSGTGTEGAAPGRMPRLGAGFIGLVHVTGAGIVLASLVDARGWSGSDLGAAALIAAAVAISERFWINFEYGRQSGNFSVSDAVFVMALVLAPASVMLVGVAGGAAIGHALRRTAPIKLAFNVGQFTIALWLAAQVYGAASDRGVFDHRDWALAALAMAVCFVVNEGSVSLVISLVERIPFREVLLPTLPISVMHWAGNVVLGILGVVLWIEDRTALALLSGPLILSYIAYRSWLRTQMEQEEMNALAAAAATISAASDLSRRMPETGATEKITALAANLNRMLGRLEAVFAREHRFLRDVSHELRTPMTICRGHLDVLGTEPTPAELRESIEVVFDELDRMARLVEDMTTVARSERPGFIRSEQVPITDFVDRLGRKAGPLLGERLTIVSDVNGASVEADPQRLTQALLNLLHNAGVHTAPSVPIELRVVEESEAWRFEVHDAGPGLPPGTEDVIFNPFHRLDPAVPGSGLGLAIVRGIANAHGGSAGVDSSRADGTTFWVRVPR